MGWGVMKKSRILSTAGLSMSQSTRLRSYCNLMQMSLTDKWLFADDFVDSHVCFIRDDYLDKMGKDKLDRAQIIVVVNMSDNSSSSQKYQLSAPLTASVIKTVLNKISVEEEFKSSKFSLGGTGDKVEKFKTAFINIRKKFFGKKTDLNVHNERQRKQKFVAGLMRKINSSEDLPFKVVFLGSPGSGKTTAIQAVSKGRALNSDVAASDSVAGMKSRTTVGVDYAEYKVARGGLEQQPVMQLFGTPGQVKFNFVWDMVGKSANAFVVLIDMSRPEPLSYLKFYLKFLNNEFNDKVPVYCVLTHNDKFQGSIIEVVGSIKKKYNKLKGIFVIDARKQHDVAVVLEKIYGHNNIGQTQNLNTNRALSFSK